MNVVSALVLFAVIWFVTLLVALPIGVTTPGRGGRGGAGDAGLGAGRRDDPAEDAVGDGGEPARSGPAICAVIIWGGITVEDIDVFNRM